MNAITMSLHECKIFTKCMKYLSEILSITECVIDVAFLSVSSTKLEVQTKQLDEICFKLLTQLA